MKIVKDGMGLETAMILCKYISETGCTMKIHERASGRLLALIWNVQFWLNTRSLGPPDAA
jgi:hypothetical protein